MSISLRSAASSTRNTCPPLSARQDFTPLVILEFPFLPFFEDFPVGARSFLQPVCLLGLAGFYRSCRLSEKALVGLVHWMDNAAKPHIYSNAFR